MIAWINDNNGFLMVVITLVYVIATIFICVFNGKSAKASMDQIITSQKQQEQNAGLQLYSLRRETINKIWKHQFDDVFWDIPLLFDEKLFEEFSNLCIENNQLVRLKTVINLFEEELKIWLPENKQVVIISQITIAKSQKEYDSLGSLIRNSIEGIGTKGLALNSVDEYIGNLKRTDDLQRVVDGKTLQLILKLRSFTRNSIQLKGKSTT